MACLLVVTRSRPAHGEKLYPVDLPAVADSRERANSRRTESCSRAQKELWLLPWRLLEDKGRDVGMYVPAQ